MKEASLTNDLETLVDSKGALLATVLDQTHDCIKLLSLDGIIQYVNRQGAMAMELGSPSDVVGQPYFARWPDEVRPTVEMARTAARRGQLGRFKASRPTPLGSTSWWDVTVSPVRGSSGEITHFATIARDMSGEVLERERVEAISLEMRHRLKNALTVAGGIIMLGARGRPEVQAFADEVVARLSELAKVQALVFNPDADQHLAQFVPMLAGAYGDKGLLEFGELPSAKLNDQSMQALALCFGELATNSLKYGALRNGRRVQINGEASDGFVELSWCEETEFGAPRPGGQGISLLDRLIRTAGGTFKHEIAKDHMHATIVLPARLT